jgi:hypothetical protein
MGYSIYIATPTKEQADKIEDALRRHNPTTHIARRDSAIDYRCEAVTNCVGFNYTGATEPERYLMVATLELLRQKFGGVFYYDHQPDAISLHGAADSRKFPVPSDYVWRSVIAGVDSYEGLIKAVSKVSVFAFLLSKE